ncbi:diguanylate cyclase domain-containing protein [Pontibacter sp. JAM-7]|uniref:GGDEF domain-containing protein n=1 Tax=Pontibacter sp. JAM-7 TaxID=3366581 RepID=UPI003AF9D8B3
MNAMDSRWLKTRADKRVTAVTRLLLLVLALMLAGGVSLMIDLKHKWQSYEQETAAKELAVFQLQGLLGYGGLVNHFKDYMLHRDSQFYTLAQHNIEAARETLSAYQNFALAQEERVALSLIRQTLDAFQGNLELIRQAVDVGEAVPGADLQMKMDSNGVSAALDLLRQHVDRARNQQFAAIENRIFQVVVLLCGVLAILAVVVLLFTARRRAVKPVLESLDTAEMHLPALQVTMICDLTGSPNRRALFEQGSKLLSQANSQDKPLSVLAVDVDNFRRINELLGPSIGDRVLLDIANRLKSYLAEGDFLARTGGDEFVLLVQQRDALAAARKLAEQLHDVMTPDYELLHRNDLLISCSVGGAMFPDDGLDLETLLKVADLRMYSVRRRYRQFRQG